MDRRAFLTRGINKAAETAVRQLDGPVRPPPANWIRPPFSGDEADFVLACTSCGACITACPHQVLFALPDRYQKPLAGTPSMNLLNRGCHLCDNWPCVDACEPGALTRPGDEAAPRLARVWIDTTRCLPYQGPECGACADSCPVPQALNWQDQKPVIDADLCTGCAQCREACFLDPKAIRVAPWAA